MGSRKVLTIWVEVPSKNNLFLNRETPNMEKRVILLCFTIFIDRLSGGHTYKSINYRCVIKNERYLLFLFVVYPKSMILKLNEGGNNLQKVSIPFRTFT